MSDNAAMNEHGKNSEEKEQNVIGKEEQDELNDKTMEKLHLDVHKCINEMQTQHGIIPRQDYEQYRSYCSRRLQRLRHNQEFIKMNGRTVLHGSGGRGKSASIYIARKHINTPKTLKHNAKNKGKNKIKNKNKKQQQQEEVLKKVEEGKEEGDLEEAEDDDEEETFEDVNHVIYLSIMLLNAERCWSAAMHIKTQHDALVADGGSLEIKPGHRKAKTTTGKLRHQFLGKLRKAAHFATKLYGMAKAMGDERTLLECHAYKSWIVGNYYLETSKWMEATREFAVCLKLMNAFASAQQQDGFTNTANDKDDPEIADYFSSRGEYTIQPLYKYCRYELEQQTGGSGDDGDNETVNLKDLLKAGSFDEDGVTSTLLSAKINNEQNKKQNPSPTEDDDGTYGEITYRGVPFKVDNSRLKGLLRKIDEMETNYNQESEKVDGDDGGKEERDKAFTNLLSAYDDATSLVERTVSQLPPNASMSIKHKQACLKGYLQYQKLAALMKRNEMLVKDMEEKKMDEGGSTGNGAGANSTDYASEMMTERASYLSHMYDILVQNAREITRLPSADEGTFINSEENNDEGDDDEDEFFMETNAQLLRYRAWKCFYSSHVYSTLGKRKESMVLLKHARSLADTAHEELVASEVSDDVVESIESLKQKIDRSTLLFKANSILAQQKLSSSMNSSLPVSMRLNECINDGGNAAALSKKNMGTPYNLYPIPPPIQAIPCKYAFFDIAQNFVTEIPNLQSTLEAHEKKTSRGIFGWFTG